MPRPATQAQLWQCCRRCEPDLDPRAVCGVLPGVVMTMSKFKVAAGRTVTGANLQGYPVGQDSQEWCKGKLARTVHIPMVLKAKMLSEDGRCKTFDASADGYARGEGCGAAFLQALACVSCTDVVLSELHVLISSCAEVQVEGALAGIPLLLGTGVNQDPS
eukprot:1057437-Amphidinium_carterae.1